MAAETVPYRYEKTQKPSPVAEVHILWITAGLGCDGDSVSKFLPATDCQASKMFCWGRFRGFPKYTLPQPRPRL